MRLRSGWYLEHVVFVDSFDFDRTAENCLRYGDSRVRMNVLAITPEYGARRHAERHVNLLLANVQAHGLAILNASWHRYVDALVLLSDSSSRAFYTLFGNLFAAAVANSASTSHEEGARLNALHSRSVALFALDGFGAWRTLGAFTAWTRVGDSHVHFFVDAATCLFERQVQDFLKTIAEWTIDTEGSASASSRFKLVYLGHLELLRVVSLSVEHGLEIPSASESVTKYGTEELLRVDLRLVLIATGATESLSTSTGTCTSHAECVILLAFLLIT